MEAVKVAKPKVRVKRTKQYESGQENQMTQQKVKRAPTTPKTEQLKIVEPKGKARAKQIIKPSHSEQLELTQQKAKPKQKIPKSEQLETGQPKAKAKPKMTSK